MAQVARPLGGVDQYHVHTHAELLAEGLPGNSCALVAELDGQVDIARVRARVAFANERFGELRWRLGRDRRLDRVWRRGGPGMRVRETRFGGELLTAAVRALDVPIGGDAPWRLDVLRGAERDAILLCWYHAATDARGAARLLAWLSSERDEVAEAVWMTGDRLVEPLDRAAVRELRQDYIEHVFELGSRPIMSLCRAARGTSAGAQHALRLRLSEKQTAAFDASLRTRARLADTSILTFCTARLVDELMSRRGFSPARQVVPVPVSLDAKRGCQRMFGNHLTMMLLALDREDLLDEARAVASIARQRRDIVRRRLDVGALAAMRATRLMPWRMVRWLSCRPFGGERSTLLLSNPGDIGLGRAFGRDVRDLFGLPSVLPSPGLQVAANRHGGRLSVVLVFREGFVSPTEMRGLLPQLERDLLADKASR